MTHDSREELRRSLANREFSAAGAERAVADLAGRESDLAVLRAAERWGSKTPEESRAMAGSLGVPESEITAMMGRLGLELDQPESLFRERLAGRARSTGVMPFHYAAERLTLILRA